MPIESVMPSNHLILCHPHLILPSIFPSMSVFSNESVFHIRWPKYWSFSFSISPSNEYSGLISFRIDWFDLLAVQGTLKSLLQHHSSKASIVEEAISFFFIFICLSAPGLSGRHIAPSSLTRDWIWAPALGVWSLDAGPLGKFREAISRSLHMEVYLTPPRSIFGASVEPSNVTSSYTPTHQNVKITNLSY